MSKKKRTGEPEEGFSTLIERDFTALAKAGTLPVGHGLDAQVAEIASLLTRGGKAPLLAGDQGVGKSALVQELARRATEGLLGESFAGIRILEVTAAGIFARTSGPKAAAELFEEMLEHLASGSPTLIFVRDVAITQGSSLIPVLIRALRAGRLR